MDGKVRQLPRCAHNYSTFSLGDTFLPLDPLYTIIRPRPVLGFERNGDLTPLVQKSWLMTRDFDERSSIAAHRTGL